MKRLCIAISTALLALGFGAAAAMTAAETVVTETFTNVVTYTIPTVIETTTEVSTVTETVTETVSPQPTTTTQPPPSGTLIVVGQPPPPSGAASQAAWTCTQPISSYATNGLPLTVRIAWTDRYAGFGHRLGSGCVGDGNPATLDLILESNADGLTRGPNEDALRVMNVGTAVRDLVVSGNVDCGPRFISTTHQDGVQILGGLNLTFRDLTVGNYDAGLSTCQGAGGAMFYSLDSVNTRVEGGKFIACNHALLAGNGSGEVRDASFRSGRNDGSDPVCNYASSNPCIFQDPDIVRGPGLVCQRWNGSAWIDQ